MADNLKNLLQDKLSQNRSSLILAAGIIMASLIFGLFFYATRTTQGTLRVIGSATQSYTSDVIKWRMSIGKVVSQDNAKAGYVQLDKDLDTLKEFLKAGGVKDSEISTQPITSYPTYNNQGQQTGYNLQQNIFIISKDVEKIEKMALSPKALYEKGIVLQNANISYFFSNLPSIKKDLLAKATQDALGRAGEIAKNAHVTLGKMESARTGVFTITEPYSSEENTYGGYNTATRTKDVTITMYVNFYLQ